MNNETPPQNRWDEVIDVYFQAVDARAAGQRDKAVRLALHLAHLLEQIDPKCEAMWGMAGRSLIADLDGDYDEAIRYSRMELAYTLSLHDALPI